MAIVVTRDLPKIGKEFGSGCDCCAVMFKPQARVVTLQIVYFEMDNDGYFRAIEMQDQNNESLFEPLVIYNDDSDYEDGEDDTECWNTLCEVLHEQCADICPELLAEKGDPLVCAHCNVPIMVGEPCGCLKYCTLSLSKKRPPGKPVMMYAVQEEDIPAELICLPCLRMMNDEIHELWTGGISYAGECYDCTLVRCCLRGDCTCCCHTK